MLPPLANLSGNMVKYSHHPKRRKRNGKEDKEDWDTLPKKNKNIEERLSEALEILSRANKVLGHAEVFIQRMKELEDAIRKFASFIERDDVTIDRNEMANTLYGIANTIEEAMEV